MKDRVKITVQIANETHETLLDARDETGASFGRQIDAAIKKPRKKRSK